MRVAEGLAAGILQPIPAIVVLHAFESGEQGKAMGIFGFGVVLAPAVGPSVGGVLVEWFGWRSIFFVVTPFCAVAIGDGGPLPAGRRARRRAGQPRRRPARRRRPRPDRRRRAGAPERHGPPARGDGSSSACSCCLQRRRDGRLRRAPAARRPAADGARAVRRTAPFAMGGLVAFIYGMALFGSTYLVPVFMQLALDLPPSQAGAVLLPAGLVLAVTIPLAGRLADRAAGEPPGQLRPAAARRLVLPDAQRRAGDSARPDHALGGRGADRSRLRAAFAQPRLDARPARTRSSRRARARSISCASSAARSASAWSATSSTGACGRMRPIRSPLSTRPSPWSARSPRWRCSRRGAWGRRASPTRRMPDRRCFPRIRAAP